MLKMALNGVKDGKPIHSIVLGLSYANLDRLKAGRPIKIDTTELGLPGGEILIFSGETEEAMAEELKEFVDPKAWQRRSAT